MDISFSKELLLEHSYCYKDNCKVVGMRRLSRRHLNEDKSVSYIPTSTICVTFLGTDLPKELILFGISFLVQPYRLSVVQCFNCLLYGTLPRKKEVQELWSCRVC